MKRVLKFLGKIGSFGGRVFTAKFYKQEWKDIPELTDSIQPVPSDTIGTSFSVATDTAGTKKFTETMNTSFSVVQDTGSVTVYRDSIGTSFTVRKSE